MQQAMIGRNRTGAAIAPERCAAMLEAVEEFQPSSEGSAQAIADIRIAYAETAEPIGTLPPPVSMKKSALSSGKSASAETAIFVDKLGERLGFERSGVRLYEALVSKFDAYAGFAGGPTRQELEHILSEELAHFEMLRECIEQLGGDPTAVTPSANLHGTMSEGICAIMIDPRTNLLQSLEAALVAELADNDCWEGLIELAEHAGAQQLMERFADALSHEQEHLANVRAWVAAGQGRPGARIAVSTSGLGSDDLEEGGDTESDVKRPGTRKSSARDGITPRSGRATRHK